MQGATVGDQGLDHRKLGISYKHLGCFADKKDDRVMTMTLRDTSMTTEVRPEGHGSSLISSGTLALKLCYECIYSQRALLDGMDGR